MSHRNCSIFDFPNEKNNKYPNNQIPEFFFEIKSNIIV